MIPTLPVKFNPILRYYLNDSHDKVLNLKDHKSVKLLLKNEISFNSVGYSTSKSKEINSFHINICDLV